MQKFSTQKTLKGKDTLFIWAEIKLSTADGIFSLSHGKKPILTSLFCAREGRWMNTVGGIKSIRAYKIGLNMKRKKIKETYWEKKKKITASSITFHIYLSDGDTNFSFLPIGLRFEIIFSLLLWVTLDFFLTELRRWLMAKKKERSLQSSRPRKATDPYIQICFILMMLSII